MKVLATEFFQGWCLNTHGLIKKPELLPEIAIADAGQIVLKWKTDDWDL